MHHFFAEENQFHDDFVCITGRDYVHAAKALRLEPHEKVLVSGPSGADYICEVEGKTKARGNENILSLKIVEKLSGNHELPVPVTLFQCIPKGARMELIIEKAVELGVIRIVPVISAHTVRRPDPAGFSSRTKHWQGKALAAAEQSKRSMVPEVEEPQRFSDAIADMAGTQLPLMPYELCGTESPISKFRDEIKSAGSIGIMIGPEGGFSAEEKALAVEKGIRLVSLGERILRTDTAAIASLSFVMLELLF